MFRNPTWRKDAISVIPSWLEMERSRSLRRLLTILKYVVLSSSLRESHKDSRYEFRIRERSFYPNSVSLNGFKVQIKVRETFKFCILLFIRWILLFILKTTFGNVKISHNIEIPISYSSFHRSFCSIMWSLPLQIKTSFSTYILFSRFLSGAALLPTEAQLDNN